LEHAVGFYGLLRTSSLHKLTKNGATCRILIEGFVVDVKGEKDLIFSKVASEKLFIF
jgi:hypothetical protein